MRAMGLMMGPSIVDGNKATELINGDAIFPSMLQAIRGRQETILFETYIYWSGEIGNDFADALAERARSGVKVHVLLDWVGSAKMDDALLDRMKTAGVEVEKFHPLRWYNLGRLNNRTHRKLLIVDGAVGFTGGVGIAPLWTGNAQDPDHWRDSHFRVEGPVVAQMQSVMLDNWSKTTGRVLHGEEYFPAAQARGHRERADVRQFAQWRQREHDDDVPAGHHRGDPQHRLSSAYFVPDDITRQALVAAIQRGVKVRIITPGKHIDAETVRRASRGLWGDLLEAGVQMYEYQPTMYHCKVMIVDGLMTSVGSTNFDVRSFRLNDEANLNIYDAGFAARQTRVFEADLTQSRRVTLTRGRRAPSPRSCTSTRWRCLGRFSSLSRRSYVLRSRAPTRLRFGGVHAGVTEEERSLQMPKTTRVQAAEGHGTRRTRGRGMKREGNMVYALFSLGVVAAVGAVYTAAIGWLWFRQERLLFEPTPLPPDQTWSSDPDVHEFIDRSARRDAFGRAAAPARPARRGVLPAWQFGQPHGLPGGPGCVPGSELRRGHVRLPRLWQEHGLHRERRAVARRRARRLGANSRGSTKASGW